MGTRFLFTTKTKIGTNTIQLKHKGLWLSKDDAKNITRQIARARLMLSSTIAAVYNRTANAEFARTYFIDVPTNEEWLIIHAKLELIYGGLNSDVTLKLGADGNYGFVRRDEGVSSTTPGAVLSEDGTYYISRERHTIHISKKQMLRNPELGIITLIHEASHKYANTFDHGNRGYREADDSGWWEPGLTKIEALNNADSYAYFVYRQGESMGA